MSAVVKGLQNSINRFYGVTIGAPIKVDGAVGMETLGALNSIVEWMPGAGYDTTFITSLTGGVGGALAPGGELTTGWGAAVVANVTTNAAVISNALDWLADDNDFTIGVVPSPPSVAVVRTSTGGKAPAIAATQLPRGRSQAAAAGILGLGLPDWAVYGGGAAFALALVLLIAKRKKAGGVDGSRHRSRPRENEYGLTFHRWWRAAGFSSERKVPTEAYDAWNRGEDPSDWRVEQQSY